MRTVPVSFSSSYVLGSYFRNESLGNNNVIVAFVFYVVIIVDSVLRHESVADVLVVTSGLIGPFYWF